MTNFVYVGNLDFTVRWPDLKDHMRLPGGPGATVGFCDVLTDDSGKSKGCAFVGYPSEADCQTAVKMNNHSWVGSRQIYVNMADDSRKCRH